MEGHPAGPGSVSSSTGAISTTTAQQEGEGSEGEGETEGDIHTSNRSDILIVKQKFILKRKLQAQALFTTNICYVFCFVSTFFVCSCVFLDRLHMVRLMLLERLLQHLSQLHNVGGVQAIPYMQVILMLTSDLDGEDEKDKGALDDLLAQLIAELGIHKKVTTVAF